MSRSTPVAEVKFAAENRYNVQMLTLKGSWSIKDSHFVLDHFGWCQLFLPITEELGSAGPRH